jgi:hypothetical protein
VLLPFVFFPYKHLMDSQTSLHWTWNLLQTTTTPCFLFTTIPKLPRYYSPYELLSSIFPAWPSRPPNLELSLELFPDHQTTLSHRTIPWALFQTTKPQYFPELYSIPPNHISLSSIPDHQTRTIPWALFQITKPELFPEFYSRPPNHNNTELFPELYSRPPNHRTIPWALFQTTKPQNYSLSSIPDHQTTISQTRLFPELHSRPIISSSIPDQNYPLSSIPDH